MASHSRYARYLALGSELIAAIMLPLILGHFYDVYFQTKPWGISIGFILALLLSLRQLMSLVNEVSKKKDDHGH